MPQACFLNAPTAKVGKNARRNLRFLHFRVRYSACRIVTVWHTFVEDFVLRAVKVGCLVVDIARDMHMGAIYREINTVSKEGATLCPAFSCHQ